MAPSYSVSALPASINFGSGLSFYDFNNDGLDDLSFTMTNDSCKFYLNTGDGFELLPSFAYADGESKCLLWVDYDNDGDLDILLTVNNGRHKLYNNDGDFNFTDVSVEAGLFLENERYYGASFADYDYDGYLDFYVCVYALDGGNNPLNATNRLYHNNGDGTFTDVTFDAGVDDGIRLSFQSVWFDYDMDGLIDLFVINDRLYANSLYKNNGDGTFTDMAVEAGITFPGQDPMTASVADFDNDGDLDIYLTNTGVGVKFPKLLVNNGNGTFTDMAGLYAVTFPHWSWGAVWVDFNNNGLQDLYVTTGNPSIFMPLVQNYAYINNGNNPFTAGNSMFSSNPMVTSFATARGDVNNDGHYDIAVLNRIPYDVFLWENTGSDNHYVKLTLAGTKSNSYAIGSYIRVYVGGNEYMQFTMCGENYLSQNSQHHIFGLGEHSAVDSVAVLYPSGHQDVYYNLPADTAYHLTEGDTYQVEIAASPSASICVGNTVNLSAGVHESYLWSTGDTTSQITVSSSGIYTVQTSNIYGVLAIDSVEIFVNPNPELFISTQNVTCAEGEDGSIYLQNLNGIPPGLVQWENGLVGDSLANLVAGTYSFVFTDINGCHGLGEVTLTEPAPLQLVVFKEDVTSAGDGSLLILISGGVPPYELLVNNTLINGNTLTDLDPGQYIVSVIDANLCILEENVEILNLVNTSNSKDNPFELYPNPANGRLHIRLPKLYQNLSATITQLDGKVLYERRFTYTDAEMLDYALPAGSYFLLLQADDERQVTRFVHTR